MRYAEIKFGTSDFFIQGLLPGDLIRLERGESVTRFHLRSNAVLLLSARCGGLFSSDSDFKEKPSGSFSEGRYKIKASSEQFSFDISKNIESVSVQKRPEWVVPDAVISKIDLTRPAWQTPINHILDSVSIDLSKLNPGGLSSSRIRTDDPDYYPGAIEMFTNSYCRRRCEQCVRQSAVRVFPDYELTPDEVETFLSQLKASGKRVKSVILCGGDLLDWTHAQTVLSMLHGCGLFDEIRILVSPVLSQIPQLKTLAEYVTRIDITLRHDIYAYRSAITAVLQPKQVVLWDGRWHMVLPEQPVEGALDGTCYVTASLLFRGRLWQCPNVVSQYLLTHNQLDIDAIDCYSREIEDELTNPTLSMKRGHCAGICDRCKDNSVIRDSKKIEHVDVSGYFPYLQKEMCREGANAGDRDMDWLPMSVLLVLRKIRERDVLYEIEMERI